MLLNTDIIVKVNFSFLISQMCFEVIPLGTKGGCGSWMKLLIFYHKRRIVLTQRLLKKHIINSNVTTFRESRHNRSQKSTSKLIGLECSSPQAPSTNGRKHGLRFVLDSKTHQHDTGMYTQLWALEGHTKTVKKCYSTADMENVPSKHSAALVIFFGLGKFLV